MTMNEQYEYIQALYERFCDCIIDVLPEMAAWEKAHERLHAVLDKKRRRLLLSLTDAHGLAVERASLECFAIGMRLGLGIAQELGQYSYVSDVEGRIARNMEVN